MTPRAELKKLLDLEIEMLIRTTGIQAVPNLKSLTLQSLPAQAYLDSAIKLATLIESLDVIEFRYNDSAPISYELMCIHQSLESIKNKL